MGGGIKNSKDDGREEETEEALRALKKSKVPFAVVHRRNQLFLSLLRKHWVTRAFFSSGHRKRAGRKKQGETTG